MDKKGDISITVIIVAAIALIVLVVLVMIFTGRMGIFTRGVEDIGQTELVKMRFNYGECQPGSAAENGFLANLKVAGEDESLKDAYRSDFNRLIGDCKEKDEGECGAPCVWKG